MCIRDSFTAYFLGKVCLARNLEPKIPEESLVTKLAFHYEEGVSRARLGSQIKTIQSMAALLEDYERERYYRRSRQRDDRGDTKNFQNGYQYNNNNYRPNYNSRNNANNPPNESHNRPNNNPASQPNNGYNNNNRLNNQSNHYNRPNNTQHQPYRPNNTNYNRPNFNSNNNDNRNRNNTDRNYRQVPYVRAESIGRNLSLIHI